jgi:hypothetical protein
MVDDWIDHIQLRRSAHAKFAVWGNKYGQDPISGRRRWMDWDKRRDLTSPRAIRKALEDEAELLGVDLDWHDALALIASIDWLTAAVIASEGGLEIPKLPAADDLLDQRALRPLGRVMIGVEWGYDMHELLMSFERWIRILGGESWTVEQPYWYEGQHFTGCWTFDERGGLVVTYDGCGVGWEGEVQSMDLITGPQMDGVDLARLALSAAPAV